MNYVIHMYHACYVTCAYNEIFYISTHTYILSVVSNFVSLLGIESEYHGAQASAYDLVSLFIKHCLEVRYLLYNIHMDIVCSMY